MSLAARRRPSTESRRRAPFAAACACRATSPSRTARRCSTPWATGEASITNFSPGADCTSTLGCLRALGVDVERDADRVHVTRRRPGRAARAGRRARLRQLRHQHASAQRRAGWRGRVRGAQRRRVAATAGRWRASSSRCGRPARAIDGRDNGRLPPLVISPVPGLHGVEHRLKVASAQVKSALLLAGLFADAETSVVEPAHDARPHRATAARDGRRRRAARRHHHAQTGPRRCSCVDVAVPGDFSSAAFWLVLGVLHPAAEVRVRDVGLNPSRTGLLTILEHMGAHSSWKTNATSRASRWPTWWRWSSPSLHGHDRRRDLVALAIDEVPLVALLGLFAEGETVVNDAAELRAKESDRLAVVADGLSRAGRRHRSHGRRLADPAVALARGTRRQRRRPPHGHAVRAGRHAGRRRRDRRRRQRRHLVPELLDRPRKP